MMRLLILASALSVGYGMLGGWTVQNPGDKLWMKKLLDLDRETSKSLRGFSDSKLTLQSVKTQVVSGMNYEFIFTVGPDAKWCELTYYSQSWTNTFKVIKDNCSLVVHSKRQFGGRVGGYHDVHDMSDPMYEGMLMQLKNDHTLHLSQNGYTIVKVEQQVVAGMNYKYTLDMGGKLCQLVIYKSFDQSLSLTSNSCSHSKRQLGMPGGFSPVTDLNDPGFQACMGATLDMVNARVNSMYRMVDQKVVSATEQVVAGMKYRFTVEVAPSSSCMNSDVSTGLTAFKCPVEMDSKIQPSTWSSECVNVAWQHTTTVLSLHMVDLPDLTENLIGGDDHDKVPHGVKLLGGDDHDKVPHGAKLLGGDDHDKVSHGVKILGGDDHDKVPHGVKLLGGDDHDKVPHGVKLLGGDGHDTVPHGVKILGGDDHDTVPHGTKLLGGDDHDFVPHSSKLLGEDDHDIVPHGAKLFGGDDHDEIPHGTKLLGGDDHDFVQHDTNLLVPDNNDLVATAVDDSLGNDNHNKVSQDSNKDSLKEVLQGKFFKVGTNQIEDEVQEYLKSGRKLLGGDDHDYLEHAKNLLGNKIRDVIDQVNNLSGGDEHGIENHAKKLIEKYAQNFVQHVLRPQMPVHAPNKDLPINAAVGAVIKDFIVEGAPKAAVNKTHKIGGDGHDDCHIGMFKDFQRKFNKLYGSTKEEKKRFLTFCDNMRMVKKLQETEKGTARYGATKFADLTKDEFKQHVGKRWDQTANKGMKRANIPKGSTPSAFDWRDHGAVTPVKNQGSCGSCWAFSTTGNIEGQWAIKKGKLVSLSEQELVDCDKIDEGCNGGLPSNAYKEIERLGGLETETEYAYKGDDEKCHFIKKDVRAYINDSVSISSNETEMASWLAANGPISIGINAFAMQFYMGGISHPWSIFCNPTELDHGVLIVGYGVQDSKPYWIVKNSWGPDWGEKGYYLVYRGAGVCGLNTMCTSSVVD